jgi:hypothetical protein
MSCGNMRKDLNLFRFDHLLLDITESVDEELGGIDTYIANRYHTALLT